MNVFSTGTHTRTETAPTSVNSHDFLIDGEIEGCQKDNTDLAGHDILPYAVAPITATWMECKQLCGKLPTCKYWTWLKENFGDSSKRGTCLVKTKKSEETSQNWAISGSMVCDFVAPCQEDNTDLYGYDIVPYEEAPITATWQECSDVCRIFPTCKFWTWLKQNYDDSSKRGTCLVKTNGEGRRSKEWALSGARDCGVSGPVPTDTLEPKPSTPATTTRHPSGSLCECLDPKGVESKQCKKRSKCFVSCDSDCSDKAQLANTKCVSSLACQSLLFDV